MKYIEFVLNLPERDLSSMNLFLHLWLRVKPIYITTLFIISIIIAGCTKQTQPETPKERLSRGKSAMEPKIVKRDHVKIIGTLIHIDPQNDKIETYVALWNQFESYRDQVESNNIDKLYYGVSLSTDKKDEFDYLAGMAVSKENAVPEGLTVREIPAAIYAVFECPVQNIAVTKHFIFQKWLPLSQYEINGTNPVFEQYPPAEDTTSPVLIHIPIKDKKTF